MKKNWWVIGLALALLVAVLSPLASPHPDGLERVAEEQGFIERAQNPWYSAIPDYVFPGIASERVATMVAGVVGTLLVFVLVMALSRLVARRRPSS